jgi:hypothetical protein
MGDIIFPIYMIGIILIVLLIVFFLNGVPSGKCGFTTLRKFNVKKPESNGYGIRLS